MSSTSFNTSGQMPRGLPAQLRDMVAEAGAVMVRLLAYVSGLALLAVIATDLWSSAATPEQAQPQPPAATWAPTQRTDRAFAVTTAEFSTKGETYVTFRHPNGGRKDVLRWGATVGQPVADIAIERAGAAQPPFEAPGTDLARRMGFDPDSVVPEAAGVMDSKFGTIGLWRVPEAPDCLGFAKDFDRPRLRISGWSCAAPTRAAQQGLLDCTLDRLILLSAGNNPDLAALFARAELRRRRCGAGLAGGVDWVTSAAAPRLRGGF